MKTKSFTLKCGEVLTLYPVKQVDLAPLAQKILPLQPKPPVQIIQTSAGQKEMVNENDTAYQDAKQAFELKQGVYMFAALIELGVDIDFTDEQQTIIDKRRKKREKMFPGTPENQFDTYIYVSMLVEDEEELAALATEISSIGTPTARQVQTHVDAFRPDVQGQGFDGDKDAPKWNRFSEPDIEFQPAPV